MGLLDAPAQRSGGLTASAKDTRAAASKGIVKTKASGAGNSAKSKVGKAKMFRTGKRKRRP